MLTEIICDTEAKRKISETLRTFTKKGIFKKRSISLDQAAEQLAKEYSKRDLESSKIDIETDIDRRRTSAAGLAILVLVLSMVANQSIKNITLLGFSPELVAFLKLLVAIVAFFIVISQFLVYLDIDKTSVLLHTIK